LKEGRGGRGEGEEGKRANALLSPLPSGLSRLRTEEYMTIRKRIGGQLIDYKRISQSQMSLTRYDPSKRRARRGKM
jgi:hypothetical protein